jgi:hypothetical protein
MPSNAWPRLVPVAAVVVALALLGLVACSSSSSSPFSKGLADFYSPAKGGPPALTSGFVSCVANHLTKADQTKVAGAKTVSASRGLADAVTIRVVRASDQCNHPITARGVQARILDSSEGPFDVTSSQKACVNNKLPATLSKLDDSKVTGSFSVDLNNAITRAFAACVPLSQYIGGLVTAQLSHTTPDQAKCVGDAVAKTSSYQDLVNSPDSVTSAVNAALAICGLQQ